jgi:DNA-binding transcriptional regulator PaaX
MSITQEILFTISNYPGGYRLIYDLIYDSNPPSSKKDEDKLGNTVRVTLSRLKRKGLITNKDGKWTINSSGKRFLSTRKHGIRKFLPIQKNNLPKVVIISFDIPEKKRYYRDWLRLELINYGFEQVQKSVWLGPVLSKEFIEYLGEIKLLEYIRFFRVSKEDLI